MDLVATASNTTSGTNTDVVVNIGTGTSRKAVVIVGCLDDGAETHSTATYDPGGANTALTPYRQEGILNSGDAFYMLDCFYIDLADGLSGSKTFRGIATGGFGSMVTVRIYENATPGAPEATGWSERATPGSTINSSVTTLTDGANVVAATMGQTSGAAPFFTPNSGQQGVAELDQDDYLGQASGDVLVPTAGVQAVQWTGDASYEVAIQVLGAWPPLDVGGGSVELVVADGLHGHAAETPALVQANTLAVNSAAHAHAADSPTLSQGFTLAPDNALHAHAADAPALTQESALTVDGAAHGHTADAPALVQAGVLAVDGAIHGHSADEVTLTVAGALGVESALHGHAAESPALVQAHVLAVVSALHAHSADSPTLSEAVMLVVQDAAHAHAAGEPALSAVVLLTVADALHGHLAQSPALTQANVLDVLDTLHAHTADAVGLGIFAAPLTGTIARDSALSGTVSRGQSLATPIERRFGLFSTLTRRP